MPLKLIRQSVSYRFRLSPSKSHPLKLDSSDTVSIGTGSIGGRCAGARSIGVRSIRVGPIRVGPTGVGPIGIGPVGIRRILFARRPPWRGPLAGAQTPPCFTLKCGLRLLLGQPLRQKFAIDRVAGNHRLRPAIALVIRKTGNIFAENAISIAWRVLRPNGRRADRVGHSDDSDDCQIPKHSIILNGKSGGAGKCPREACFSKATGQ